MPDEVVAESSPAETTQAEPVAPPPAEDFKVPGIFDPEEKAAPAEKPEESAPSEKETEPEVENKETEGESASASEAANRSEQEIEDKPGSKAEKRIKQLTAQVKALERQMTERQQAPPTPTQIMQQPVRPDLDNFTTKEEYDAALEKYEGDVKRFAVELDRVQRKQQEAVESQKRVEAEAMKEFTKRAERIEKANPGFRQEVPKMLSVVQPNPTTDGFFLDSEVGPEILNYLYENPEDAERIRDLKPYQTIRELVKLENQISDQIKGIKTKPVPVPPKKSQGRESTPTAPRTAADILYG